VSDVAKEIDEEHEEDDDEYSLFAVDAFSSYFGGDSEERYSIGKISEGELLPEVVHMVS